MPRPATKRIPADRRMIFGGVLNLRGKLGDHFLLPIARRHSDYAHRFRAPQLAALAAERKRGHALPLDTPSVNDAAIAPPTRSEPPHIPTGTRRPPHRQPFRSLGLSPSSPRRGRMAPRCAITAGSPRVIGTKIRPRTRTPLRCTPSSLRSPETPDGTSPRTARPCSCASPALRGTTTVRSRRTRQAESREPLRLLSKYHETSV